VGDPVFCTRYDAVLGAVTSRCVNDRDLVPHLPPRELGKAEATLVGGGPVAERYEHVGQLRLLLADGGLSDDPDEEAAREPDFLAHPRTLASLLGLGPFLVGAPARLKDHWPINPVTHDGYVERIEALP
jgi:hypothetical protein